ncbi:MAG: methylmalonyl-CoA mutase family protein [Roseiarcus sp.]
MSAAASVFPAYSEDDWRKAAAAALKGAPVDKLVSKTSDGIALGPIHVAATGPRALRAASGAWKALARLDHPDAGAANETALEDLGNGADGLQIVFAGATGAYGYGLARADSPTLLRALEGVRFDEGATFELDLGPDQAVQARTFASVIGLAGVEPAKVDAAFGLDPLGLRIRSGRALQPWAEEAEGLAKLAAELGAAGFRGPFFAADGRAIHAAGGTPAQELAFALAAAVEYLRALVDNGQPAQAARAAIEFRLAADADEFLTLAKFRAIRLLWASVAETAGLEPTPARVHAESAWRMMTVRAPFINVTRAAMAAFAAGLGGADSVALLPLSRAIGLPDSFARRLARNSQLVELRESHLGFVADPAAGAGVFEAMTDALIAKAWEKFQAFEREGGLARALSSGAFQKEIGEAAAALKRDAARLKTPLTGVSAHPDIGEQPIETAPSAPVTVEFAGESFAPPLAPMRVAEAFEALRDAAESLPQRPKIFLAAIGMPAANSRRVAFSRDFYEAGGFETVADAGASDGETSAERFRASDAAMACLCGSDVDYATHAEAFARALKAAGVSYLMLAGRPGDKEAAWREAGVDGFIFLGQDAISVLQPLLARAGAKV